MMGRCSHGVRVDDVGDPLCAQCESLSEFAAGDHVYVKSGPSTGAEGPIDYIDVDGVRALVNVGDGRKGGLTWVELSDLHNRSR